MPIFQIFDIVILQRAASLPGSVDAHADFIIEVSSMKRVQSACLCQTLHFLLKDGTEQQEAVQQIHAEVEQYFKKLQRTSTKYKVLEQTTQPDGSVIIKIIKQYNECPLGSYLD